VRVADAYPAYFGTYSDINKIKEFVEQLENLIPVGRAGLHRYNNQDHSMLTAMHAVDNISQGRRPTEGVWEINTEPEYLEAK
jgi:arginine/lysine/ornithine decarboxylase